MSNSEDTQPLSKDPVRSGKDAAVVIPFFQRSPGILARTVRAVLAQSGVGPFSIVVVDDASPVPAHDELRDVMLEAEGRIILVEQPNAGAAGARNKGLDSLPQGTRHVAFVDSDDEWGPGHLANALFALDRGFDFYFADFYQLGQQVTAFDRARRINIGDHPLIEGSAEVREYRGDMIDQIITGNILGTSVTAYAYHRFPELRFRLGFRHTGEEYLFWLDLALRSRRIAFGDRPECRYGSGVNIYSEASWDTEKFMTVAIDEIKYRRRIIEEYPISPAQRQILRARIRQLRDRFTLGLLHHARANRRLPAGKVLRDYLAVDPGYPLTMWPAVLRALLAKKRA